MDLSSLSLQSSAVEQVLYILMYFLSWEIAEVVSHCLPRGLWSHIVIRVFLLLGTVCPRHPPYPVLPSCPLSRAFPYLQPGDAGGRRSAPAVCQSLTSADPTNGYSILIFKALKLLNTIIPYTYLRTSHTAAMRATLDHANCKNWRILTIMISLKIVVCCRPMRRVVVTLLLDLNGQWILWCIKKKSCLLYTSDAADE